MYLAIVAGLCRAIDMGSVPEIAQYGPYYLSLNVSLLPKDQTFIFIKETRRLIVMQEIMLFAILVTGGRHKSIN